MLSAGFSSVITLPLPFFMVVSSFIGLLFLSGKFITKDALSSQSAYTPEANLAPHKQNNLLQ